jgi:hypothetical protein
MTAESRNSSAQRRSFAKDDLARTKDELKGGRTRLFGPRAEKPTGSCAWPKYCSHAQCALSVRGASNRQIARNGVRTAATRLSPVDWDMDSNQGFILASGAWRGRDVVGRTGYKSQNPAQRLLSLCDSGLSAGPRSLGEVTAVL